MKDLLRNLYEQFLSNMIHEKNTDVVVPIRMSTAEALSFFQEEKIKADIIYVDASHDEQGVYTDLTLYYPLLKSGGVICGDDWSARASVRKAVRRFAKKHRMIFHAKGNSREFVPKKN